MSGMERSRVDEEKRIKWNDEKRERIRIKNKYKKIKENMKRGGVCGEYVDDVRTYRWPMTAMERKGHIFWSFISIIPPFSFPAFLTSL